MYNLKFGKNSMKKSSSEKANNNTALGSDSFKNNVEGYQNTAIGSDSLKLNINGINNSALGYRALKNTNGQSNIGIGALSGLTLKSGRRNIIIGKEADVSSSNANNQIVIGEKSKGIYDNSIVLGNNDTTLVHPSTNGKVKLGNNKYSFDSIYADSLNVPKFKGDYITINSNTTKVKGRFMLNMGKHEITYSTTITTAQIKSGYFLISSMDSGNLVSLPSAVDLIKDLPLKEDGDSFDMRIVNTTANNVNLTTGTGSTLVYSGMGGFLMIRRTSSTTVEVIGLGSMVNITL